MNIDLIIGILNIVLISTTPLVFAGIGELVTEKSGVLNLGLEGLMLMGAVSGFIVLVLTGNYFFSFFASRHKAPITQPNLQSAVSAKRFKRST